MKELIYKDDAIAICKRFASAKYRVPYLEQAFDAIPAVEPWELYNPDEWCQDCKEYDTEKHKCPRWNRVIRKTLGGNIVIDPETIERGSETYIGEDIVVCHQEDYMDMMCKAMQWDEYGEKQSEWIDKAISIINDMRSEGIVDYEQAREFRMRARMKGASGVLEGNR